MNRWISIIIFLMLVIQGIFGEEGPTNSSCTNFHSCDTCVTDVKCYWCTDVEKCFDYEVTHVSSYFKHCGWGEARWRHCWLNVMALVITSSVFGFILLIALIVVCCWCRRKCRQRASAQSAREEAELEHREDERKERNEAKKAERSARANEVRQKYGLLKEDD